MRKDAALLKLYIYLASERAPGGYCTAKLKIVLTASYVQDSW